MNNLLGRLNFDALPDDPVTIGGGIMMSLTGLLVIGFLIYTKRWKWLWNEWLTSLDPKKIGIMYIIVALLMLLRGGTDAMMIRLQQATASGGDGIFTTDLFQQVFSAHGTIMIFFVAMGLMFGLINLVLPLQIGARDVAFPFLNSVSFWLFAAGMVLMNISLVIGEFSAAGWLAYPPLSGLEYSPGVGVDYWIWSLQIAGVGSLLSGINFLVTILKMRAPGMTLMKLPMFCWSVMGSMILVIFAFPILTATLGMLSLDRLMGMHFFTSDFGGNPMMYINLIWAWGHPEVYILILPAFGIFSEVVATFSRKRLFGYTSMVWAIGAITFLSFIVWLHHFFTMGAGANVNAFFGIMTMIIAVPTGVKVFNWLFTMYRGRIHYATPMLWFLGFVTTFTIGGATGVLMSVPAIDFQVHNSLFLVAHFHNMIIGGVVFGFFAGLTYWFPKVFGFKLNEALGKVAFFCWLFGFLLAFMPLYALGILGATRRLDSYDPSMGWQGLFIVAAIGVGVIMIGLAAQILQLAYSIYKRRENMDTTGDPWNGRTLEWSTKSPAPFYNFAVIPEVNERDAFWEMKQTKQDLRAKHYQDIYLPKNTGAGIIIAGFAFMAGFALIWHIWWLAFAGLLGIIASLIIRTKNDDSEYKVPAATIKELEAKT
ncbi:cytochrome o ubiquinol oxidase subunit I [Candidatus Parcubacteria bacterium]|nr:cytochrome o ubiquinol oxidase subunit I [Candidatus Parcubacteria bacterium]